MKLKMCCILLPLFAALPAHAIGINSMLEYVDSSGRAEFIITNSEDSRQYINVQLAELLVENGDIRKLPYSRENVNKWVMSAHPSRAIVEPGFKKTFLLMHQPIVGEPDFNKDRVFQVSFVPSPYFDEDELAKENSTVKMAFGFAPIVIIPAKEPQPLTYKMTYHDDRVMVENNGNTAFSLFLDGCPEKIIDKERGKCTTNATVLAGRNLSIPLPTAMVGKSTLKAKLATYGNKFSADVTLKKQS
ncbi:hypothetical protein C3737_22100 [Aeromonas jandaei]|uniref:hypothetical protein n=1 Tax=Aeromonas jandaei TaxID=650 RepID=UPI000CE214F3|nr:hypothetical protein [Aeromonas jandaei]PPA27882.1 hypothetical protein C3737_22100 [Aeromonas jandaei]